MKKAISCLLVSAALGAAVFSMAACDNGGMLAKEPNQSISAGVSESVKSYDKYAYYELENPSDVKFAFETTGSIQKVTYKYKNVGYSVKNDTIVIDKKVFKDETSGEKRIRVFVDNQYVEVALRVVTKVIRTTDDFNTIRTNMNGVYVLGNDIDFGNELFWPIGKAYMDNGSTGVFEGIFDGMGYAIKNVTVNTRDWATGEDGNHQGPSLGSQEGNGNNYGNGIFMTTSANAQIVNTDFVNITVNSQGLSGAVAGTNGGLIKNCRVSCTLTHHGYFERGGGIAGLNAGGDSAGRIENCIVVYKSSGGSRGIADWNSGTILNCFASTDDSYILHPAYDSEEGKVSEDFDYNTWLTDYVPDKAEEDWQEKLSHSFYNVDNLVKALGNHTIVALPGALGTSMMHDTYDASGNKSDVTATFYSGGSIVNSEIVRKDFFLNPLNFPEEDGWDYTVWNFQAGTYPTLRTQR